MSTDIPTWPLAGAALSTELLSLLYLAKLSRQIRKGTNEVTKSLTHADAALIVSAADTAPLAIVFHIPLLCEDKNVPYVYAGSKVELGRACGVGWPVVAVSVVVGAASDLIGRVERMKD